MSLYAGLIVVRLVNFHKTRNDATFQLIQATNQLIRTGFFGTMSKTDNGLESRMTAHDIQAIVGIDQVCVHLKAICRDEHHESQAALEDGVKWLEDWITKLQREGVLNQEEIGRIQSEGRGKADAVAQSKPRMATFLSPLWKHL